MRENFKHLKLCIFEKTNIICNGQENKTNTSQRNNNSHNST
jgi:hypothetical protein